MTAGEGAPGRAGGGGAELRRALGPALVTFYGLGTIIGAGIYVLVGKVAGNAGMQAPVAFLVAAVVAALTAVSYAQLSARFPRSAGAAVYVEETFHRRWLAAVVGWSVVLTASVSAAAIANGFVGYLQVFVAAPGWLTIGVLVLALVTLAAWGIGESAGAAAAITVLEIAGLVFVIGVAGESLRDLPARIGEMVPAVRVEAAAAQWHGILLGAVLAFYAFIGFEDIVNVAEETRAPERNLPLAIYVSLGGALVLYLLVAVVAVLSLPRPVLAASGAPLADIVAAQGYDPRWSIALVSLLAVTNGALIQIIVASRVLYGMARQGAAPARLGRVHPGRRTPGLATAWVGGAVLALALWFPVETLARGTSVMTLLVFATVNLAALRLRARRAAGASRLLGGAVPLGGVVTCLGLLLWQVGATLR